MLRWLWLSAAVLVCDQGTKWIAEHYLVLHNPVNILPFLNFTLVYNPGAAFSFLSQELGWQRWLFSALAVLVSLGILIWLRWLSREERWTAAGLSLILGGAVGNLVDRLLYGHVIDFIDVFVKSYHWPTFNIADSAITVGAAILVIHSLLARPKEVREA